jgi:hypothetical protein
MGMIAYRLVRDDLMLFMAGNAAPSESEWNEYVLVLTAAAEKLRPFNKPFRFICFVDDSPPNAKQRAAVVDALGGLQSKTAVITNSVLARNLITVFSWLGLNVKGYSPASLEAVAVYLNLPPAFLEQAVDSARLLVPTVSGGVSSFDAMERTRYGGSGRHA